MKKISSKLTHAHTPTKLFLRVRRVNELDESSGGKKNGAFGQIKGGEGREMYGSMLDNYSSLDT